MHPLKDLCPLPNWHEQGRCMAARSTKRLEEKWVCHEKRLLIASQWTKEGASTSGKGGRPKDTVP